MYVYLFCSLYNVGVSFKKVFFYSCFKILKIFENENFFGDWFWNVVLFGLSVVFLKGNNLKELFFFLFL